MTNAMLEKWKPEALKVDPIDNLPVPESVLVGEAVDVSKFCIKYWQATRDESGAVVLPGLELAERPGLFEKAIGSELFELQEAVHAAHARYLLTVQAAAGAPMERAQFVLGELRSGLGFLFDDGVIDDNWDRMSRVRAVARYVFRHHPELVRKTTSSFARRTRNKRNRDKAASGAVQPVPPPEVSA